MYELCLNLYEFVALIMWNVDNNYGLYVYILYGMHASMVLYIIICCECVEGMTFFLVVSTMIHPFVLVEWLVNVEIKKPPSITVETWFWQSP